MSYRDEDLQSPSGQTRRRRRTASATGNGLPSAGGGVGTHPQEPATPSSPSYYNPVSHYTPQNRSPRKQVMGMTILTPPASSLVREKSTLHDSLHSSSPLRKDIDPGEDANGTPDTDDSISIGSLELLEQLASRIRTELRTRQLQEISLEAERAAEAGEESFRARPVTFPEESTDVIYDQNTATELVLDSSNHTSSTSAPSSRNVRWAPVTTAAGALTLPVADLRDAHAVFPSFGLLHNNLRTHCKRQNVQQVQFREESEERIDQRTSSQQSMTLHGTGCPAGMELEGNAKAILASFKWSKKREHHSKAKLTSLANGKTDKVKNMRPTGEVLADHIFDPSCGKPERRPIQIPRGLLIPSLLERSSSFEQAAGSLSDDAFRRPDRQRRSRSEALPQEVRYQLERDESPISPRALFDEEFSDDDNNSVVQSSNLVSKIQTDTDTDDLVRSPNTGTGRNSKVPLPPPKDFETPARLRGIRKTSTNLSASFSESECQQLLQNSTSQSEVFDDRLDTRELEKILLPSNLGELPPQNQRDSTTYLFAGMDANSQSTSPLAIEIPKLQLNPSVSPPTNLNVSSMSSNDRKSYLVVTGSRTSTEITPKELLSEEHEVNTSLLSLLPNMSTAEERNSSSHSINIPFYQRDASHSGSSLFVSDADNDAFLQNYLYRRREHGMYPSVDKHAGPQDQDDTCGVNYQCNVESTGCCYDIFPQLETIASRRSKGPRLLGRNPSKSRLVGETWYDIANERLDGVLENLIGTLQPKDDWSHQFEAPTLQKSLEDIPVLHRDSSHVESQSCPPAAVQEKGPVEEKKDEYVQYEENSPSTTTKSRHQHRHSATVIFVDTEDGRPVVSIQSSPSF